MAYLRGQRDLEHRGNKGRGKTVAGDIGNEHTEVGAVNLDKVVEIAGHGSHRKEAGGDIEAREFGQRVRKDRKLNLASHFELVADGEKSLGQLGAGFPEENMAADAGFNDGGREGLVYVVDRADFEAAGFVFDAGLAGEEDDRDFAGRGICLQAGANLVAIHAGHHDVEKYEVRLFVGGGESESLFAVGGYLRFVKIL